MLAKLALTIVGASAAVVLLRPAVNQAAATALALPLAELPTAGVGQVARFVVAQNTAMPKLAKVYEQTPLATLRAWQAFNVADDAAPLLSERFVNAHFEFHDKFMSGLAEPRSRQKRAAAFEGRDDELGPGRMVMLHCPDRYADFGSDSTDAQCVEAVPGDHCDGRVGDAISRTSRRCVDHTIVW